MRFQIDGKDFELSIFDAQAAMERCEQMAGMSATSTAPTVELLHSVTAWAQSRFSVQLSGTAAWQLWWSICELMDRTRKAYQRIADVGAWLHVDGTRLGELEMYGLYANLPRVKAQATLQAGKFDPAAYDAIYQLVLVATGDEKQAREARAQALERFVDSRCGGN